MSVQMVAGEYPGYGFTDCLEAFTLEVQPKYRLGEINTIAGLGA